VSLVDVTTAVGQIVYRGETSNIADGLNRSSTILTNKAYGIRLDIPKTLLVIAAGSPDNAELTVTQVELIKSLNIRILTVGVGPKVNKHIFEL